VLGRLVRLCCYCLMGLVWSEVRGGERLWEIPLVVLHLVVAGCMLSVG
jgi:hypothetical protein